MKGNAMMVTTVSFQDIMNMKINCPTALMPLRRKMLTFWEMRSLTWVVSADRREMMSPAGRRRRQTAPSMEEAHIQIHNMDGEMDEWMYSVPKSPVWFSSKKPISCLIRALKKWFLSRRFNLANIRVKTPPRTPIASELRRG